MSGCTRFFVVRAFTLIELLIVVAIIAVLAAIAVPNFLEAQVRAKVSRIKSDLRTVATAIEAYSMDHNRPPVDGWPGSDHFGWVNSLQQVTTPVAYITSVLADQFQDSSMRSVVPPPGQTFYVDHPNKNRHSYDYGTAQWHEVGSNPLATKLWYTALGNSPWKIGSCGPDQKFVISDAGYFGFGNKYDPTNGTISEGDLYRSQAVHP